MTRTSASNLTARSASEAQKFFSHRDDVQTSLHETSLNERGRVAADALC
jgi:hypothetical protein